MIFVFWREDCKYGAEGKEDFETREQAEEWMNQHIQFKFQVIEGAYLRIALVEVVKRIKLEKP